MRWREEIEELHDFFEAYFLGRESSLARVEAALAPGFTIVGPDGVESDRDSTLAALASGHSHAVAMTISTLDHCLLVETDATIVARYVERHESAQGQSRRMSTVVFAVDPSGPNGLRWLRVHETWMERSGADDGP